MASQAKLATLEELVACFNDLEDPRSQINRKHPLVSVVAISIMRSWPEPMVPRQFIAGPKAWQDNCRRSLICRTEFRHVM